MRTVVTAPFVLIFARAVLVPISAPSNTDADHLGCFKHGLCHYWAFIPSHFTSKQRNKIYRVAKTIILNKVLAV
ncbi:hypothetical protein [Vibrio coralliilyticus]|uniref:hypothetical protein n=1 Tax=Vibrio coralliilyticus TaxID=190893 RepID=UPI0020B80A69|nr:hypothetical protein [Vibrio coralliilyticus]